MHHTHSTQTQPNKHMRRVASLGQTLQRWRGAGREWVHIFLIPYFAFLFSLKFFDAHFFPFYLFFSLSPSLSLSHSPSVDFGFPNTHRSSYVWIVCVTFARWLSKYVQFECPHIHSRMHTYFRLDFYLLEWAWVWVNELFSNMMVVFGYWNPSAVCWHYCWVAVSFAVCRVPCTLWRR